MHALAGPQHMMTRHTAAAAPASQAKEVAAEAAGSWPEHFPVDQSIPVPDPSTLFGDSLLLYTNNGSREL